MRLSIWSRRRGDEAAVAADSAAENAEIAATREAKHREFTEKNQRDATLWDERVEALPAYVQKPTCPKCLDAGIAVSFLRPVFNHYEPGFSSAFSYAPSYRGDPAPARHAALHHKCEHCGYEWKTKAADHGGGLPETNHTETK